MRLSAPTMIVFIIALVLAIISIPAVNAAIPLLKTWPDIWFAWAAYVLLAIGTLFKGV